VRGSGRGYLRFPKSLYDSLLLALPSAALLKTALAVVRLTIGHHDQASARISATTIADRSGLARDTVIRALRQLRHEGVLVRVSESKGRRAAEWRIDPEPAHWGRYHVAVENAVACDERPEVAGFAWTAEPSS
jgi:phage replication O-like protein O